MAEFFSSPAKKDRKFFLNLKEKIGQFCEKIQTVCVLDYHSTDYRFYSIELGGNDPYMNII